MASTFSWVSASDALVEGKIVRFPVMLMCIVCFSGMYLPDIFSPARKAADRDGPKVPRKDDDVQVVKYVTKRTPERIWSVVSMVVLV